MNPEDIGKKLPLANPDAPDGPFRIAFRHEGEFVCCYYASIDSMDGAVLLGTMRTSMLRADNGLWTGWKNMMSLAIGDAATKATGVNIIGYKERTAPGHERKQ